MSAAGCWARRTFIVLLSACWASAALAQPAPDGSRVALIIGNSEYSAVGRLGNPVNDAEAVGEAFLRLGFDVTIATDLDYASMRRALQDFEVKVATAEYAVVFYAGHGIEINGTNYLIPVDAQLKRDTHVFDETIPLERVLTSVEQASAFRLVILDACRDNPFADQMELTGATRAISRGLVRYEPTPSSILAYAAREGTTADDGAGEHSPYTTALLQRLETPGMEVGFLFRHVRDDVMAATGGVQEPVFFNTLGSDPVYLAAAEAQLPERQIGRADETDQGNIVVAYEAARAIDTVEAWQSFLRYYPTGLYPDLARAALNKLRGEVDGVTEMLPAPVGVDGPVFVDAGAGEDGPAAAMSACENLAAYAHDLDRPDGVAAVSDTEIQIDFRPVLDACRIAVELNPENRWALASLARVADLGDRPDEAYRTALAAAELGSAQAMVLVGRYRQFGISAEQDLELAVDWYRRSADAGNSDGMLRLGYLYDQGLGVALDLDESGRWLARAAEAGNPAAIAAIGYRFDRGRGVDEDSVEARYWYERAALRGDSFAMQSLAALYEFGEGGGVDLELARQWYERAAELGEGVSMASLGYFYEAGIGVEVDVAVARQWYERGAAEGDHISMYALGNLYEFGLGVEQDYEEAARWFSQSALTGEMPLALIPLGQFFDQGLGVEQNFGTALELWQEAAAAGEADALAYLGYLYELGRGVEQDLAEAARYYVAALAGGSVFAVELFTDSPDGYPPAIRRAIEAFLIGEGLLHGKPDGIFDDTTRAALAEIG